MPNSSKLANDSATNVLMLRFRHMVNYHAGEMTEWENNFCLDNIHYITEHPQAMGTDGILSKLKEIENTYCGAMCHALQKAGRNHA